MREVLSMSKIIYPLPRMRTIAAAAKELNIAEYFVRKLVHQNKIVYVKAGKKSLVNLDSLIKYLNTGEPTAAEV